MTEGENAGATAAATMLALRANDGSAAPHLPHTLIAAPGVYQLTPGVAFPQFAGWAHVTPFAMNSGAQFRSDPSETNQPRSSPLDGDSTWQLARLHALVNLALSDAAVYPLASELRVAGAARAPTLAFDEPLAISCARQA